MQQSRNGRIGERRSEDEAGQGRAKQRAFCIAALEEGGDLSELRELLRTAGVAVVGQMIQRRDKPHPNSYLGPGKLVEVKAAAKAADANVIACDDELSPRQERNLEEELGMPVVDRTSVILDIFAGHAHSAEGKLQVELAQLEYNMARMRGLWTHLERLGASAASPASAPADRASRRSRPTAGWPATASRRCAASSRAWRRRGRRCAPSASARICRRSRSPATRTPASRRCSTG